MRDKPSRPKFPRAFPGDTLLPRHQPSPGGGIGRHRGLKIPRPLRLCGFESRPGHFAGVGLLSSFAHEKRAEKLSARE